MKVFFSATSFRQSYGGPAYSVSRLVLALAEQNVEAGVWSADGSAPSDDIMQHSRVQLLPGKLNEALEAFGRADVIHDNGLWLKHNHALAAFARGERIPRIVSTRGMLEPWARTHKRVKKIIAWRLYQRRDVETAAALHATSTEEGENIAKLKLGTGVVVIPNGVDLPELGRNSSEVTIETKRVALFLGRIYPVKGLPMFLEAWSRVRPPGWEFVIAGPDEAGHLEEVRRIVRARSLSESVTITGPAHGRAKTELFRRASLVVLPSLSESFGMAIAEGLAHGVPVLTTTAAPWPQLESSASGWRVRPTVEGLVDGLKQATVLGEVELKSMGERGRDLVASQFQWRQVARQFRQVYETVAE